MIVIATIICTDGVRVDPKTEPSTKASESAGDAKAEALTLVIHKFVPAPTKIRPVQVIERNDDVVVIHSNRPKRRPSSRKRRPSSQYRSKIKHLAAGSSPLAGFKDFSSSDFRFPPFPTKNYGEPPRSSNKYKFGPPTKSFESYGYNAQPSSKKSRRPPPTLYGPPPSFNQYESTFNQQQLSPSSPFNEKTLQTLQQQQASFPSFSIDTVEPTTNNFYGGNSNSDRFNSNSDRFNSNSDRYSTNSDRFNSNTDRFNSNSDRYSTNSDRLPQPISNFPLESGSSFNSPKTSYGKPVRKQNQNQNQIQNQGSDDNSNFQFNPSLLGSNLNTNLNTIFNTNSNHKTNFNSNANQISNINSNLNPHLSNLNFNLNQIQNANQNQNANTNFPKLPNRYEPKDFSTPTRTNPLANNHFNHDFSIYNEEQESKNVPKTANRNRNNFNSFNKFNNFDYDFKGQKNPDREPDVPDDDEDEENLDYLFSARRPVATTTTTEAPTTTKRPRRNSFGKRKRPNQIPQSHNLDTDDLRDAFTESSDFHEVALSSDDFINFDSQRHKKRKNQPQSLHEIPSTLKTARSQNEALRTALGDDFEIVSIHKSLERNPQEVDFSGFQRKNDQQDANEFRVGSEINFGAAGAPVTWNGDFKNFPRNHRFSA